jgi:DinB superfamily
MTFVRSTMLLATLVPATLAAQQTIPPANPITATAGRYMMYQQGNIAQAFDSIPERLFTYKPTPAQLTIGYIAQHVTDDNYFFCDGFGDMKGSRAVKDTATADSIKATWPRDTLLAQLKASFAFCESAFAQLSDASLADQVERHLPNGRTRQVTRAGFVFGHIADLADHYSQLANYMRLNGILPPTALPREGRGGE